MSTAACVFCEIAAGARAAHLVCDEGERLAFLDHRPLFPGHVLVVPRGHFETIEDLPAAEIAPLFALVQRMSRAVREATSSQGIFLAVNNRVSQSVPHLHVHVVPRNRGDKLKGFFWPRRPYRGPEHMSEVRAAIADRLAPAAQPGLETPRPGPAG